MLTVAECIVVNTGPLVSLGRAGALAIIGRLPIHFLAPREVADELAAGARLGHPVEMPSWVEVAALAAPLNALARQVLDSGEAAVIQLALERRLEDVCIDEWRGRRAAKSVGLRVTGSLGLLGRAKQIGLVPQVRAWVERLIAVGAYYDTALIRSFLAAMDE